MKTSPRISYTQPDANVRGAQCDKGTHYNCYVKSCGCPCHKAMSFKYFRGSMTGRSA